MEAGDIVIFGDDKHIGIVSDKRNVTVNRILYITEVKRKGKKLPEECRRNWHYRFDASLIDSKFLIEWVG